MVIQFELKSISVESIPEALAKVERYRLLNEPDLAMNAKSAQELLPQIKGDCEQAYYAGIIWERLGNARIRQSFGGGASAYHALREAMDHYERAMKLAPPGNDDAILRWNTCARVIMRTPDIRPSPEKNPAEAWAQDEASSIIPPGIARETFCSPVR